MSDPQTTILPMNPIKIQGYNHGLEDAALYLEKFAARTHPDHEEKRTALLSAAHAIRNSKRTA